MTVLAAEEPVKNPPMVLGRNPGPGIRDVQDDAFMLAPQGERYRTAVRGIFHGIRNEIVDYDTQLLPVAPKHHRLEMQRGADAARIGRRAMIVDDALGARVEPHRRELEA